MANEVVTGTRIDRGDFAALFAMCLGILVVANDFTALSVVVVDIEQDLDTTLNRAQWVINAYTVVFAVLIVTGGRLADIFGRRKLFVIGAAIFGTFSLLGGFAPDVNLLIAARAAMGVGGALMWPSVLGMVYAIIPEDRAGFAGGLVIGVAGLGNAMGPVLAGVLTDALSWRWVFFINVPIAVIAIVMTTRFVSESAAGERVRIDYRGILTLAAAVVLVLVGLDYGTNAGFGDPVVLTLIAAGLLLLVLFAILERGSGPLALVPRRVTASPQFVSAALSTVLMSAIYFAVLVFIPQFTENDLGWSALGAGAALLPVMLVFAVMSFVGGHLYNLVGARAVVGAGAACLTAGVLWLAFAVGSDYGVLIPGLAIVGVGVGLFYSAITTAAVTAVDDEDSSLAGGIIYMANVAGGSIGIGLNTAIVLAASDLAEGIRNAFLVDAALGAVGTVVAMALIQGDGARYHPLHRLYHRAHG